VDVEEHVCQSCGVPMKPEDYAGGSEEGDFCSFCMVHNEFAADREAVKTRIADRIQETSGKSRGEAEAEAEDTMKGLDRWAVG
jgi:Putative zinc ribbon domain